MSDKASTPPLLGWGKQDQFLHHELAPLSLHYCEAGQLKLLEEATHWQQHDKANLVKQLIHRFIHQYPSSAGSPFLHNIYLFFP